MNSKNGFNIYDKVYQKLLELEFEKIQVSEFYTIVENMKIPKEEIVGLIEEDLTKAGLTATQVDRICSNLSFKLRWTHRDAKNVEKHLRERGLIHRISPFKFEIKKPEN